MDKEKTDYRKPNRAQKDSFARRHNRWRSERAAKLVSGESDECSGDKYCNCFECTIGSDRKEMDLYEQIVFLGGE